MRILITGANGQVGRSLQEQLQQHPAADLLALTRQTLDITKRDAVAETVLSFRPDILINAAAHTAVDQAESEPELAAAVNEHGARHLAEAAHAAGTAMLHLSTDYVFDGQSGAPYRETHPTAPQSVYGRTKLAGEAAVSAACPHSVIVRTAWVFGEHGRNFVKTMLRLGKERSTLGIVADQYGAPTYAGDIAAALIRIAGQLAAGQTDAYGLYHFSGSPYASWYEFAAEIFAQAKKQGLLPRMPALQPIATADYPTPARRPADSRLHTGKIQAAFGIAPSDWRAALADLRPYCQP
ncbi:MAG: dTDP-4-dehydrorhamnose reductase [Eikenella sp.]|nr:dTDP-4-dehydrorhamnose reductase [Eikenella sp.]